MDEIQQAYDAMRAAVVEQCIKDYAKAIQVLQRKRQNKITRNAYIHLYNDCREFLLDEQRLSLYTDIDGQMIIDTLNECFGWQRGKMNYD